MRPDRAVWVVLFTMATVGLLAAHYFPYFPGDVPVARWLQSLVSPNLNWALVVSRVVDFPYVLAILGLIFALSWTLAGWRAAALSIFCFAVMLAVANWLIGPVIARPRPSPELVRVFRPFHGSSFPSLSVLCYATTFGFLAVLAAVKSSGWRRAGLLLAGAVLLLLCGVARIALGAHWPSDVILSFYLGLLWAAFLIRFAPLK